MSVAQDIRSKLEEYEQTGHYIGMISDLWGLVGHIECLEEEISDLKAATAECDRFAKEICISASNIIIDGRRIPWLVQENPEVVPFTDEMVALRVLIPTYRVTVKSNVEES